MAHNFKDKNIGVGITGSYCTYKKVFEELRRLADTQANLFTIFSDNASSTDSRFGKCKDFLKLAEEISGKPLIADLAKMPHLLVAGATGSGKSVCINTIITSLLYKSSPEEVKLLLIDPKVVELAHYNGIPHLLSPVVTDPKKASNALNWAVNEMNKRYQLFAENGVKDITGYNKKCEDKMYKIVIIIDE